MTVCAGCRHTGAGVLNVILGLVTEQAVGLVRGGEDRSSVQPMAGEASQLVVYADQREAAGDLRVIERDVGPGTVDGVTVRTCRRCAGAGVLSVVIAPVTG